MAEERVMIGDPMEGCRREDRIDRLGDRDRALEIGDEELDPCTKPGEPRPGLVDHGRRPVQSDDGSSLQAHRQHLRDPAAAATGVEDPLVAAER